MTRKILEKLEKLYIKILLFIAKHKRLNKTIGETKLYKHLVYEEAQRIIGNR